MSVKDETTEDVFKRAMEDMKQSLMTEVQQSITDELKNEMKKYVMFNTKTVEKNKLKTR